MVRQIASACLVLPLLVTAPNVADAATISRETLERRLLDTCVYRQFGVKDVNRQRMVDDCRCATKAAMQTIEGEVFQEPRSGGLTGPQDQAIRAGIAACFR